MAGRTASLLPSNYKKYADKLKPGGCFVYEIGYDQAEDVKTIAKENGFECEVYKDSSGIERMAVLKEP